MLVTLAVSAGARNVYQKKQLARTQFEAAERLREELNGRPVAERTPRDYQRVTDAFRRVYYTSPTSSKADAAVVAVAELLSESGRRFDDPKLLRSAIGQYEFLRREYPGSKYRVDALFTIGQIYKEDLNNREQAKATFQEFLKHYPRSSLAADAKSAITELEQPVEKPKKNGNVKDAAEAAHEAPAAQHTGLPLVTGIRHWSTPDYTRVAIDLEAAVKYQAGRVPDPDRIFFDLHDAKLSSTLLGKSFDVQDGFLRKVRVAQYQRTITRVVLEVDDLADYSVFLLPNPYRLIIDIHGQEAAKGKCRDAACSVSAQKPAPVATAAATVLPAQGPTSAKSEQMLGAKEKAEAATPAPAQPPLKLATRAADGTTTPLKFDQLAPPANAGVSRPEVKNSGAARDQGSGKPAVRAAISAKKPEQAPPPRAQASVEPKGAVQKGAGDSVPDTTTFAKLEPPELKAGTPTSAPTFESVAPRMSASKAVRRPVVAESSIHEARPTANGERSLIRALGLKIGTIVVDAGHGGHDTGTIGPDGLQEKDLVLDVALRLGKLLQTKLGANVIYTRDDDTFVPLETRTAIANQNQADLFVSIHANSSNDPSARGVETYYLNFTTSADALEVAARENAVSETSIHELQDLVKKIALKEKIEESREFASDVQKALWSGEAYKNPAVRNRGVKKAPFIVLIGANMPSVLAEVSFLSNPADERKLETPEYRQRIAEYLYRGISRYVSGLSGVKVAKREAPPARHPSTEKN